MLAAAALASVTGTSTLSGQPNILLIMLDQQRHDLAYTGLTPNLDRLASEGLRLTSLYSSTPTCTPARSALLTGRSPWGHGMLGYGTVAPAWPLEMPSHLAAAGWETVAVGKNHFFTKNGENASTVPPHGYARRWLYDGLGDGRTAASGELDDYDVFFAKATGGDDPLRTCGLDWNSWRGCASGYAYNESLHPTAWVAATARPYLQERPADAPPFFLKESFHRPHSPYDPPARVFNATAQPPSPITGGNWDKNFTTNSAWCGPSSPDAWCGSMPPEAAAEARRSYRASLSFVDEHIGALLAAVDLNDTWVIHISDHGDGQGDHGLWRKGFPYELSSHVPGSIRWPSGYPASIARGTASDALVELRDVFPTVATIASAWPLPARAPPVEGVPLTCLIGGPAAPASCADAPWRTSLDLEHSTLFNETIHWSALVGNARTPSFAGAKLKYIFLAFWAAEQLFDLSADPNEMTNLAPDPHYALELAAWRAAMVQQFESEGRGPSWVKGGMLQQRVVGQLCSPNFPDKSRC